MCKKTKLEQDIDSGKKKLKKIEEYDKTRSELEKRYDEIVDGVKIRSKSSWYQFDKKFTKFVYGPEKKNAICGTIKMLIYDGKQITMPNEINLTLKSFYENLFQKDIKKICF